MNACALALVLRGAEAFLVSVGRVHEQPHAQAKQYGNDGSKSFQGSLRGSLVDLGGVGDFLPVDHLGMVQCSHVLDE